MKNALFSNISNRTIYELISLAATFQENTKTSRRALINQNSPYSEDINKYIGSFEELCFYRNSNLTEAIVTRRSLIRKIDTNLFVTSRGKTNLELMKGGNPPYAYDGDDGIIELHHIGQDLNAPFAELIHEEHMKHGNSKKLHNSENESWRNDESSEKKYAKERALYWKKRAKNDIKTFSFSDSLSCVNEKEIQPIDSSELLTVIARLFAESSPEDLRFISDSAKMCAIFKDLGAASMSEFAEQNATEGRLQCTRCESDNYCSYGTYTSNGEKRQRYKCNNCGQIFTPIQRSIISESNLSFPTWINLITCLYYGMSVAATAKMCNLSTKSVQNNRLRLFYALRILDEKVKLRGKIAIDETYFAVSFKGNRTESKGFSMERKAHKRGGENHTPGLSKEHACVVCALDEYGNSVARVVGAGIPDHNAIKLALGDTICKNDVVCLYSDKELAIKKYAKLNGYPIKQIKSTDARRKNYDSITVEKTHWIQKINSFHSRLKKFVSKFGGISSDLLYGYLCLFTWINRNRDKEPVEAYKELFNVMIQPNLYKSLDEISAIYCFRDLTVPREKNKRISIKNLEQAKEIYAKYAGGETVINLAKEYNCSRTLIYNKINKINQLGYGYKTEKEKKRDEELEKTKGIPCPYENSIVERNKCIYTEKMAWKGSAQGFYQEASAKYSLSIQSIKQIVSEEKRIVSLQAPITVMHRFEHKDLPTSYQTIYNEYSKLVNNGMGKCKAITIVAEKHGYSEINIRKIISKLEKGELSDVKKKKRLTKNEAKVRDKELFSEYLRWNGTKSEFYIWAQDKYKISNSYIHQILQYNYVADPRRYEMTYEYPTQQ